MAREKESFSVSLLAAADYSAKQYYLMNLNSSAAAVLASASGQQVIGVLQDIPESGAVGKVMTHGISKVIYGDTVTMGDRLCTNASGKAIKSTAPGEFCFGVALESGAADEIGTVLLLPGAAPANTAKVISIPINLATVADGDVLTTYTPGFAGRIESVAFAVTQEVTTGSKASTLNLEIGTTDLTGGVVALTSANCTTLGAVVAGSSVTAANVFTSTDTISIEASSTTAFAEGAGVLLITVR